jgi:hypothetical protein
MVQYFYWSHRDGRFDYRGIEYTNIYASFQRLSGVVLEQVVWFAVSLISTDLSGKYVTFVISGSISD